MKRTTVLVSTMLLLLARLSLADVPAGFTWVNLESDKATMTLVRHALQDDSISAIREVGVEDDFALVMTASREAGAPTTDYDRWSIYNISLTTGKSRVLVSGYGVKMLDWIGVAKDELAITYYDCWECEAATLFTTLHFKKASGWTARWSNKTLDTAFPQPGAVALMADVGESDDDSDVEQVFAVVAQPNGGFAVGSWVRSHNSKSGKSDDDVERYSIDPNRKEDHVERLNGNAALSWERQICTESSILIQPSTGQHSKACRGAVRSEIPHRPVPK
jgi:hypothetical protein